MSPIPIAFIGGSLQSAVGNTHRISSQMDDRFQLVAGCFSRDKSMNSATGKEWNIDSNRIYSHWEDLLQSERSTETVVVLLTPTPHHSEVLQAAISNGFRVICEKSLTTSVSSTKSLLKKQGGAHPRLHAVYNYTGYPMIRELRAIIKNGELGNLLHCQVEMPQEGFLRRNLDGTNVQPQEWRKNDSFIPTVSLDLGIHVVNLFRFVTDETILKVVGSYQSKGNVPGVIDHVSVLGHCSNEVKADFRFGKTSLGHSNGLAISCFGTLGSAWWIQSDPEILNLSDTFGRTTKIHRGSIDCKVAQESRYNRFKAGHPSGFIEAFSNHYFDIADVIEHPDNSSMYTFSIADAVIDMQVLHAISESVERDAWTEVAS